MERSGRTVTADTQDLYSDTWKTLLGETEEELNEQR